MLEPPIETLIIRRRLFERFDQFALRVMLWQALDDRLEWLPSLLPWRGVGAVRITRPDRPPNLEIDPIATCEPIRFLVQHFVREELAKVHFSPDRPADP